MPADALRNEVIEVDVLVIGGGLAGCWAALRAKDLAGRVLLVEKARVGSSGASTFCAGDILWWTPQDDLEAWLQHYAERGGFLLDPEWFELLCRNIYERVLEMDSWGAPFEKDEHGDLVRKQGRGTDAAVVFPGYQLMKFMRRKVLERGARVMDRICVTRLLKEGDGVVGAVGFNTINGRFCTIKAGATVIASGGCCWKGNYYGLDMICGESFALAYEAGAALSNMEYSNTFNSSTPRFDIYGMSRFQRLGGKFTNAGGERFMEKYDPEMKDGAYTHTLAMAMYREMKAGRGPVYFDLIEMPEKDRALSLKLLPMLFKLLERSGLDLFKERAEWMPSFVGAMGSAKGIKLTDTDCSSTVPGLYAAGDAACQGLVIGAIMGPGAINLTWAIVTGFLAGEAAARFAQERGVLEPGTAQIQQAREYTLRPLNRKKGASPDDLYYELQKIVIPGEHSIIRQGERMQQALARALEIQDEAGRLRAQDPHYLVKCHETVASALTTEMVYRSGLLRTESRGGHFREDYPETDNKNWLKWITLEKSVGGMALSTQAVPLHKYQKYGITPPST